MRIALGLEDPILVQYVRFMGNALQGEFGLSYRIKRSVSELIVERIPATLELVFVSAIIALGLGHTDGRLHRDQPVEQPAQQARC